MFSSFRFHVETFAFGKLRVLKSTLARHSVHTVSGTKDHIAALLRVALAAGVEELELVGGSSLGAIVKVGTCLQRIGLGARRRRIGGDGAA